LKITWGLENASYNERTIATLGSYDGVHLGHQKILERLCERKDELGLARSVLLTFHPHPQEVLRRNNPSIELLTTIEERLALIAEQGIDETVVIEFTKEFAQTSYIDFFQNTIVGKLGTKAMVVGFNHAFGKNREGDAEHLKQLAPRLGVSIEEVPPFVLNEVAISSTKIRNALQSNDLANANAWLGRPYSFSGTVIHDEAIGRELGYPTANLDVALPKLVPADGVYAARVFWRGNRHLAALSIGTKPTTHEGGERAIECLLLDFDGDLYNESLTVECLHYLRPQEKFADLESLKQAISSDVTAVRSMLN
jgi:riboflavin kinase/FMN adenylyltransferase